MASVPDQLDTDLQAAFETLLKSRSFRSELIDWIDATDDDERRGVLSGRLARTAKEVFMRGH